MENDQSESTIAGSQHSGRNFSIIGHPLPQGHPAVEPTSRDEDRGGQVIDSGQLGQQPRARGASSSRKLDEAPSFNSRSRNDNETNGHCPTQRDETKSEQAGQQGQDENEFKVSWDGDHDSMNPKCMSKARKWLIVAILSTSSTCVTCASSLYTSTYALLEQEFHCSKIVATLGLSIFVAGLGIGPMLLGPLSEFYGRRYIYIVSFVLFVIWLVPCAVAQNIQTILVARFFDGVAGSAFLSVAGGTVGDMFSREELQAPMMIFTASPFIGPPIGPLIGNFINQFANWRWSFYVLLIWAGVMLVLITLFIPETYHPVLLRRKAIKVRDETGDKRWHAPIEKMDKSILQTIIRSCYRPFLLLTLEPMCLNLCIFSALLLGVLYLWFGAFNLVFENNHGFEQWQVGLTYIGIFIGILMAIASGGLYWDRNYSRLLESHEKQGGEPGGSEPEYRLPPAIAGAILVPIGLFWYVQVKESYENMGC
jgi:multidrug resistance protein